MRTALCIALPLLVIAAPAFAATEPKPLPLDVRAMLEAAIASDNDADITTIAKIAGQTNPDAKPEIAAMVNARNQAKEAKRIAALENAGMVQLWKGRIELGGFRSTGATNEVGLSGGFSLTRQGLKWSHKLLGSADYRRANGATSSEHYLLSYQPKYQFDPKGFAYGLAQFERDPFIGYDSRLTASAGIGYKLVSDKKIDLSVDVGPSLRHASYTDGTIEDKIGGRSSIDFGWKLTPTLTFRQNASAYMENGLQSATSASSLDTRLISRLTARFSYNVQYEAQSRLTAESLNTLSKVTFVYDF